MRFYADLHIHSKYSRACSRDCDIEHLTWWARRKGISVVGTGDVTHPAWFQHLNEVLEPAEPGLFRLRPELDRAQRQAMPATPPTMAPDVRFMLSVEISTIYSYGGRTRKIHHLCYLPDFAAAEEFNRRLGRIGNLGSDGRPILGLDSRDLLEITLDSGDGAYLVPAHIWTPWFAVLGSKAGFDSIGDCYRDLAGHIFALETGLSSDPEMNWRISGLDRYTLVSHSDAHSPPMLGREASVFDTEIDYYAIRRALETGIGYEGTVEFFPEEGKYHLDGHRKCAERLHPTETRARDRLCPSCGKPVTVGVLHRVEDLADRPEGRRPDGAAGFRNLIPLPEIVGEIVGVGPKSKRVRREIDALTARHGPELAILDDVPLDELEQDSAALAEAIRRLRRDQVIREAGYDGEYGTIRLFDPSELPELRQPDTPALFEAPTVAGRATTRRSTPPPTPRKPAASGTDAPGQRPTATSEVSDSMESGPLAGLDPEQRAAAEIDSGPLLIVAGPGTGKTRTVTRRIAHLVQDCGVDPGSCLAITFTRRAAAEMTERLTQLLGDRATSITVATFHALGHLMVSEQHDRLGLGSEPAVADATVQHEVLTAVVGDERTARRLRPEVSRIRRGGATDDEDPDLDGVVIPRYLTALRERGLVDYDDLLALPVRLLESDPQVRMHYRQWFRWITVDEYQDVDELQYRMLRLLAPGDTDPAAPPGTTQATGPANLTVIGDPDQAIYAFRGADVGYFLRFRDDYPEAREVQLTRNYRSGPHIITGALATIRPVTLVADRQLVPMRSGGSSTPADAGAPSRITLHAAADERAEAAFVAHTIDQLLGGTSLHSLDSGRAHGDGSDGLSFADIAVLYRTDAQAAAILDALSRSGYPAQKRSHDPLSARPGVEHILRELTHTSSATAGDVPVLDRLRTAAEAAVSKLVGADRERRASEVHHAVELLAPLARDHAEDLTAFREQVLLGAEVDALDPRAEAVSLLTLHAAKGLEFPVVFLVGCEDGLLPLRWPGAEEEPEDDAEERRLCFVGMTRAQDHLYLTHARARRRGDSPQQRTPSPFLRELSGLQAAVTSAAAAPPRRRAHQLSLL
ncbi:UvrD-helicase domain-containing protein [Lipingzhangella sp. LS1_29]|uniref:DNA 3'-5' helicase n=1 Tax=Lipingzhangella rawalii TaxID=2055835 RepID=A0ABU2H563_9ACTN|nr:UvrD-helicase domain-containing protein [Lipingzhangella rawalii]MDS1270446.1 UvrD-helicase domain-containing protein [Lipingzhangella rawalii]